MLVLSIPDNQAISNQQQQQLLLLCQNLLFTSSCKLLHVKVAQLYLYITGGSTPDACACLCSIYFCQSTNNNE
jgi:hypothetical protein